MKVLGCQNTRLYLCVHDPRIPLPTRNNWPTHLVISSKAVSGRASISTSRDRISKSRVWGFGGAMSVRVFCSGDMGWWLPLPFGSPGRPLPQPPGLCPSYLAPPPVTRPLPQPWVFPAHPRSRRSAWCLSSRPRSL